MNQTTSFSVKRFIFSSLGYFVIFAAIIGMFYLADPEMLEYQFLFVASAIAALVLGAYHAKYKNQDDMDAAVDADIAHIEETVEDKVEKIEDEIKEDIEKVSKKLHR